LKLLAIAPRRDAIAIVPLPDHELSYQLLWNARLECPVRVRRTAQG
jgi:hypothetical protein